MLHPVLQMKSPAQQLTKNRFGSQLQLGTGNGELGKN